MCCPPGVHVLIAPGLLLGNESAQHLKLLITAAGGTVVGSPQRVLQLAAQQQQRKAEGDSPAGAPLQLDQQQHKQRLLVLVSTQEKAQDHKSQRQRQQGPGDNVILKDFNWARESGLPNGWPLYNREWLIQSVMTYSVDWDTPCARI